MLVVGVPCCRQKGVPEQCIGLCMYPKSSESRQMSFRSSPLHFCSEHEEVIKECKLSSGGGMYFLYLYAVASLTRLYID